MHAAAIRRPRSAAAAPDAAAVARLLLAWYRRARRDLPWRRSSDPYAIWVSEIMLQQTQVERVKEYFTRFLARFPDVESLAAARVDDVLRHWEGLGYYRRGRHLHEAARRIVADHGGRMPRSVEALRSLPGIGRYTAGAIASIAFNAREPVVEANSRRVIARLFAHDRPLDGTGGDEPIWRIAAALVPARGAGRFNQALMDLGAMVCTPTRPLCGTCPLASLCLAHRTGRSAEIPRRAGSETIVAIRETAVVVRRRDRVLVVRRGAGEWWSGLWDFPRLPGSGRTASAAITRSDLLGGLGCTAAARLGTLAHSVTRHRIRLDVVTCTARRPGTSAAGRRWVRRGELARLAMSSPGRRIARLIGD